MVEVVKSRIRSFKTAAKLSEWLERYHDSETELWVKIYKKNSGINSVSWNDVVIESLCWGWIDSVKKSLDESAYLQRITPRKKTSNWSKRNTEHAEKLILDGRMRKAGLVHITAAKGDGRWDNAYAPSSEMRVPENFLEALENNTKAKAFYTSLNKSNLYAIVYRLTTAKKPETRQKRFDQIISMLENKEKFH